MTKIAIREEDITEAEVLKVRVMNLKGELRKLGIKHPWSFFKYYHMDYSEMKFRSCINTQQSDLDFTEKLEAMVNKLKADKKTSIEDKQG